MVLLTYVSICNVLIVDFLTSVAGVFVRRG
jgi:hypothetical protein